MSFPMRARRLTIAVVSIAAFSIAAQDPGGADGGAGGVVLSIEGADPALAGETRDFLSSAYAELERASRFAIEDTVHVVYVRRAQSFDSVVGGRFPDWGIAAAVGERSLIAVRSPADYPLTRSLRETLRHELAHLHLDAMSGLRQLPRWMHEGYAQQFAHEWVFGDDLLIARAVFFDHAIELRDIDGVNSFAGPRAQLAYTESYLAMNYFLAAYGHDGLLLFCQTVRGGGNWDAAFRDATGADYLAFQQEFTEFLNARYNWVAFLGDTILLWIGLVGLFIVIYIIKRRRSAARRAEWEEQEALADILYGPLTRPDDDQESPSPPSPSP
jgi:hypothetical protein